MNIKYQLYKETVQGRSTKERLLYNRGIDANNQEKWLLAGKSNYNDWRLLDNMESAVEKVHNAVENFLPTVIVQDCDCDGYTSTAIMINYLYMRSPNFVKQCVRVIGHSGKQHGLSDLMNKIKEIDTGVADGLGLILIPDAGRITA